MNTIDEHFLEHGVKPTAVRVLVWREIQNLVGAFTLEDVAALLPHMDKSSIFRTLRLFSEKSLLHEINDGMGFQKYCVCRCHGPRHLWHVHFSCVKCGHTYCLEDLEVPLVQLPEGYEMIDTEYVIKGICPKCKSL